MTTKSPGTTAPDGSLYATPTDGNGNLVTAQTSAGATKPTGRYAPDGSLYLTFTDGNGNV